MNYDHVPISLFISCSRSLEDPQTNSDLLQAYRLKESLEKQGFTALIYRENFALGTEQWQASMKELIHPALAVLCLVSPNTPETDYVNRELAFVEAYEQLTVYPVWIAGDDWNAIAPRALRGQRFFDVRHGQYSPTGLAELVTVLNAQYRDGEPEIEPNPGPGPKPEGPSTPSFPPLSIQALMHNLSLLFFKRRNRDLDLDDNRARVTQKTDTIAPYKGLEPFTQRDAQYFFGREQLIEKIIDRIVSLTEQQPQPNAEAPLRFISIVGASGSGKSSLVMAGVMSRLRKRDQRWICLTPIRPGYDPLGKLAQVLAAFQPPNNKAVSADTLAKNLRDNSTSLQKLTAAIAKHRRCKLVLYIDQFEELFVTGIDRADQELFIDRLESVARDPNGHVFVLITLRADFYAHWLDHNRLATLLEQQTITVPAMNIEQLRDVIEKPAERVGLTFEGNLVGDLLNDISRQREALPLLQFTLKKLYDRSDHRLLTTHIYEELGGVNGALDHYAEDIYQGNLPDGQSLTSDSQREMARHLFSKLIYINGSVDNATRRRATMSDFQLNDAEEHQTMQETIEVFVKARLLILDNQGPTKTTVEDPLTTTSDVLGQPLYNDTTLEISHEALIREWKSLRNWIELHQDDMHIQQNVDDSSKKWKSAAEPKKQLYRGRELAKARSWAANNKPTAIQMRFIQESRKQQTKNTFVRTLGIIGGTLVAILIIGLIINAIVKNIEGEKFVVTNTQDQGEGSLRQQLSQVSNGGVIHFDSSLRGPIILSSHDLIFDKNVTIVGPSQKNIEISNANKSRIIINANKTVTLQNLAFTKSITDSSSFITNQGDLTLNSCDIHGNNTGNNGGGISNEGNGTLTIQDTIIKDNTASRNGGGIYTHSGIVNISHSSITNNVSKSNGGGIYGLQGSVSVYNHSEINSNQATGGDGGGIDAYHSFLIVIASTIEGNTSKTNGGGIAVVGSQATISTAVISGNNAKLYGGGVATVKDTANGIPSLLTINNTETGSSINPNDLYAIRQNTSSEKDTSDILGSPTTLGKATSPRETTYIQSNDIDYSQGNPAPSFMPETELAKTNYLPINDGDTSDLNTFCQSKDYSYGSLSTDKDKTATDIQIKCFSATGDQSQVFPARTFCQKAFPKEQDVYDRLADYNDQSSLQCYHDVRELGLGHGLSEMKTIIQSFCQSKGKSLISDTLVTAYDWKCTSSDGTSTGIGITDVCQRFTKNPRAFDRLVNYDRPDGWQCLAPNN